MMLKWTSFTMSLNFSDSRIILLKSFLPYCDTYQGEMTSWTRKKKKKCMKNLEFVGNLDLAEMSECLILHLFSVLWSSDLPVVTVLLAQQHCSQKQSLPLSLWLWIHHWLCGSRNLSNCSYKWSKILVILPTPELTPPISSGPLAGVILSQTITTNESKTWIVAALISLRHTGSNYRLLDL